jgi:aminoglycoside/choline kinase family phosphotransferase
MSSESVSTTKSAPHSNSTTASCVDDPRRAALLDWLCTLSAEHRLQPDSLRSASDDASFRRYFRIDGDAAGQSRIVMDAPPPMENCAPFVHAAQVFAGAGMTVPAVLAADLEQGFLLLEDFGDTTYLQVLDERNADALYADASRSLVAMQAASHPDVFPAYDRDLLLRELMLYPEWYVARHKGLQLTEQEHATLLSAFDALIAGNLAQPSVFVHRDFHSRNLMLLQGAANPGVLDFQDAVTGPITYDLVSLLRDAYIRWPEERVLDWAIRHWERARAAGLPVARDFADFWRDFEWMGLQRHLKVLGIFARLFHRDGKDRYLADLPLVYEYAIGVASRYNALAPLARLLERVEQRAPAVGYTF